MKPQSIEFAFGSILRKLRSKKRLSQEALAAACKLDRTYISLLERGLRQPTLSTVFRLSRVLGVSPSKIVRMMERSLSEN